MVHRDLKGQVSFEVLIALAILSLIFLFAFTSYIEKETEVGWSENFLDAKRECYEISSLINRVRVNGVNFVERSSFNTYKIRVNGDLRSIEVSWDSSTTYCMFPTVNVTNTTHQRFDVFGNYKIFNDGTNVVFEKI